MKLGDPFGNIDILENKLVVPKTPNVSPLFSGRLYMNLVNARYSS